MTILPLTALNYFPRPALTGQVRQIVESGLVHAITLIAPRRRGKTLFVKNEVMPWADASGWTPVYIDLWADREHPEDELIRGLVKAMRKSWIADKLAKIKLKGKTPVAELEAEFERAHSAAETKKPELQLAEAMDGLMKQVRGGLFLLLDEFQALAGTAREDFVAAFRAAMLKHGKKLFVFYTGSSKDALMEMFRNQNAPLFDSAYSLELPDLGADFVEDRLAFLKSRTRLRIAKPELLAAFEAVQRSPEALNDIVLRLIINNDGDVAAALKQWKRSVAMDRRPRDWNRYSLLERRILQSIANGKTHGFSSADGVAALDATQSRVLAALRKLTRAGVIVSGHARGEYLLVDQDTTEFLRQGNSDVSAKLLVAQGQHSRGDGANLRQRQ